MSNEINGPVPSQVRQLRLLVEANDFDDVVHFYRDVLELPEQVAFQREGEARVVIPEAGRATLELANPAQRRMIDQIEVRHDTVTRIRVAFEVDDTATVATELAAAGATEVAPRPRHHGARSTPGWMDLPACNSPFSRNSSHWPSQRTGPGSARPQYATPAERGRCAYVVVADQREVASHDLAVVAVCADHAQCCPISFRVRYSVGSKATGPYSSA
jgi:catechol 2,3-dioxygenase-like lactoylglutathione lyase family enzyme